MDSKYTFFHLPRMKFHNTYENTSLMMGYLVWYFHIIGDYYINLDTNLTTTIVKYNHFLLPFTIIK